MKLDITDSPSIIMLMGFALVLVLMLSLGFVGLTRMANIYWHMEQIVNDRNVKTERAQVMKDALRERALLMHTISVLTDPFDRDADALAFDEKGSMYANTRQRLESMDLNEAELAILARIQNLTKITQPLVTDAVNLSMDGKSEEAQSLIREKGYPAQKNLAAEIDNLINLEYAETERAWNEAKESYQSARLLMIALGAAATALGFLIAFLVIRHSQQQASTLRHQATYDRLTNLPNRALFADRIQQSILISRREKQSFAIIAVDLDRFKEINDAMGHHVGDLVLQQIARQSRECLRESDTFARMGGDEFVILLPSTQYTDGAIITAKKIIHAINQPMQIAGQRLEISASLGIAIFPEHGDTAEVLLRNADAAMYEAKRTQLGYTVYRADLDQHAEQRMQLHSELRHAIENNELALHYQPKIRFDNGRVSGVEALVRWQHPARGLLFPDAFIELAETTGLIKPLTMAVLKMALHQCEQWYQAGLNLTVAVNISTLSIQDPEFPDQLSELLRHVSIPISLLELEITETAVMTGAARAVKCIKRLHDLGTQIAIDDFGTGYSSMSRLKELLVAQIKIDKSFVKDMAVNHNDAVIVRSTVELGHSLGMKVIAEGVEDQAAWEKLKSIGCDSAQGYYMSRPIPVEKLHLWLRESPWGLTTLDTATRNA
ncbi:MAG: EAL domain-containing protein [Gammaproteobacteria bacterium]|nr:EAL domain-containing protein [Gammaproteobacteria bacterium]